MNRKMWARGCLAAGLVLAGVAGHALWTARDPMPAAQPQEIARSEQRQPVEPSTPAPITQPTPVVQAPPPAEMAFQRLSFDTSGERLEACLEFSQPLTDSLDVRYADYLRLSPAAPSSLRIAGHRLCVGGLAYGVEYTATVLAGLPALSGARTGAEENVPVYMADQPPLIAFPESGFILPRSGTGLGIQTVNIDKLKVSVLRIGDRQVFRNLGDLRSRQSYYSYRIENLKENAATVVWSGEMDIRSRRNEKVVTSFPIAQALPVRKPGIYMVVAENAAGTDNDDRYYHEVAAQTLVDTDIALSTFTGADGLHVMVRSLETAKPLPGVTIALIARGNDELAKAVSDDAGHVGFAPGLLRGEGGARPAAVMAYGASEDFAVLDLGRPAFDLSDRGVSGRDMPGAFDAYLYSDRGIYRPGETVHVAVLLRDQQARAVHDTPVTIIVSRPNGGEFKRFALKDAKTGAFLLDLDLPDTASRGLWSAAAFVDPTGQPVGRVEFDVQDFVPQRLKVTAALAAAAIEPDKPVNLAVDGQFLYGAPAAGLSGEVLVKVEKDPQPFATAAGYAFGLVDDAFRVKDYEFAIDETDPQGHADLALELTGLPRTSLPLRAQIDSGLFEPGGRSTRTQTIVPLRTAASYVGIKPLFGNGRTRLDSEAAFEVQAFDADGHPIAADRLDYNFIREVVNYNYAYSGGRWNYVVSTRDRRIDSGTVAGTAERPVSLKLSTDWGRYRIEVRDRDRGAVTSFRFAAGWQASEEEAERPDLVEMAVDKPAYRDGETVRVNIKPPFAGEVTLAVATDRVHELRHLSVPAEGATVEIQATADWGAGAYMLATIQRPVDKARNHEPVRAVGIAWAGLDMSERKLAVAIDAPAVARPRSRLSLPVTVTGAADETVWLTLAAVDEGILQLTRFRSPDPDSHYFSKRRLGLELRDDYGRLLDGNAGPVGAIRAGGDAGLGGASLPVVPTRTVALFSGAVAVDREGRATVAFDVPDFAGQLRLMAVVFGSTRMGHGEARVLVRDPVVAEVSLPRFLAPDDVGRLTLSVHNVEGRAGTYTAALTTEGPIGFEAPVAPAYELAADARRTESFALRGTGEGIGTVRLALTGPDGFAIDREWQIAVRSPWLPVTLEAVASQAPGESFTVDRRLLDAFTPGGATVAVNYGLVRGIDVGGLLQSLWRYPYGCTEQTVSVAMPLLYVDDPGLLAESREAGQPTGGKTTDAAALRQRVQRAVDTVIDRQDEGGDIGLWRVGDGQTDPWIAVYALDFLARAKQQGYVVPDHALRLGRQALSRIATADGNANAQAFAFLTLARQRAVDIGSLRYFHDTRLAKLTGAHAAAQLGAALALVGDRGRSGNAFAVAARHLGDGVPVRDYYASPLRNLAVAVAAGAEAGATAYVEQAMPRMIDAMRPVADLNTIEKTWLTLAASAMSRDGRVEIAVNDLVLAGGSGQRSLAPSPDAIERGYSVANVGSRPLWRNLVVHGTPLTAPPPLSAGVTIRKTLYDLQGNLLDATQMKQNQRVIVKIEGKLDASAYGQLVVVDMLPAGLEAEAAVAIDEEHRSVPYKWLGELSAPSMRELRDDRIVSVVEPYDTDGSSSNYYDTQLPKGSFSFAYIARAITPGTYTLPGVAVEDMYKPAIMARSAPASLTILAP